MIGLNSDQITSYIKFKGVDLEVIIGSINGIIALGEIWLYLGSDCLNLVFEA